MNDWRDLPAETHDGCPLALGVVATVGRVGVNRRSTPEYAAAQPQQNVVGGWPDDTLLLIWAVAPATYPPGTWLYGQAVTGDVALTWVHGAGVRAGQLVSRGR